MMNVETMAFHGKASLLMIVLLLLSSAITSDARRGSRRAQNDRQKASVLRRAQVVELENFRYAGKYSGKYSSTSNSSSKSKSKSKSCKLEGSGKVGKSGKGLPCAPTAEPSAEPSPAPSFSSEPTMSNAPSASPMVSLEPSATPSASPTKTFEPSKYPSSSPTMTFLPSEMPSREPSDYPSVSQYPTISAEPSSSPEPSESETPTNDPFLTIANPVGLESTCERQPPLDLPGTLQPQHIVFLYNLYVPEGTEHVDAQSSMRDVEARLHDGLTAHFLTCDVEEEMKYGDGKDFYIWSISSAPVDILTFDECTQDYSNSTEPPENSDCFQVMADFGMIAFFPITRRVLEVWVKADQQVLEATGDFLDYSMEEGDFNDATVLQTQFQGFVMPVDPADGPNVAGANSQLQTSKAESRVAAGYTAMGFALLFLLVVILFAVRRRNSRAELYQQHLENMSDCSDLYKDGASIDHTVSIVNDASFDWMDNNGDVASPTNIKTRSGKCSGEAIDHQHDVHKCTSAFCSACRELQSSQPTFLPSAKVSPHAQDILDDLRYSPNVFDDCRSYSTPDTVNL